MDEKDVVCKYNGIFLNQEMNEIRSFAANWLDLDTLILTDIIQTEKGKFRMISLIGGI